MPPGSGWPTQAQSAPDASNGAAAPEDAMTDEVLEPSLGDATRPALAESPADPQSADGMRGAHGGAPVSGQGEEESAQAHSPRATRRGASSASAGPHAPVEPAVPQPQAPPTVPQARATGGQLSSISITPQTGDDCGQCAMCADKPRFGGPGIKRKACLAKRSGAAMRAPVVIESVVKAPALATPALATPRHAEDGGENSAQLSSQAASTGLSAGAAASSGGAATLGDASLEVSHPGAGGRERNDRYANLRERVLRKEYGLRKRGAEAGEQILSEPAIMSAPADAPSQQQPDAEMMLPALSEQSTNGSDAACQECDTCEEEAQKPAGSLMEPAASSTPAAASAGPSKDADDFEAVKLVGMGLDEEEEGAVPDDSPRPPLNELLIYKNGVPCTPQLKTPEIEALASGGALGMSPLSEFANLLEMTPRLPVSEQGGAHPNGAAGPSSGGSYSPLWQLASLMERTPRLPPAEGGASAAAKPAPAQQPAALDAPADPEELGDALLNGGLESPAPGDTPGSAGQLRRDLTRALLQAGALASPHPSLEGGAPSDSTSAMMPPPPPVSKGQLGLKARKRKLEADLGIGGGGLEEHLGANLAEADGEERLMLRELLEGDSLGLPLADSLRPPLKRSKPKNKEKGKPQRCRCDRSGCLKRYCVCFAAGNVCINGECKCKGCENDDTTMERQQKREAAVAEMQKKKANAFQSRFGGDGEEKAHLTGCNCKRSGCIRRYCECFQSGVKCTEKCKCCDCKNPAGSNPNSKPMPPEAIKQTVTSPGGSVLPMEVIVAPELGSPGGSLLKFSPLKATNPANFVVLQTKLQPPSPTAFVDGALLAAASAAAGHGSNRAVLDTALDVPMPDVASSSSLTHDRVGSAAGSEAEESELLDAAQTSLLHAAASSGLGRKATNYAMGVAPPPQISLPGPSPDLFAADTPEPWGDSRCLGPTPPAKMAPSPSRLAALPVLVPVLPMPKGAGSQGTRVPPKKGDAPSVLDVRVVSVPQQPGSSAAAATDVAMGDAPSALCV